MKLKIESQSRRLILSDRENAQKTLAMWAHAAGGTGRDGPMVRVCDGREGVNERRGRLRKCSCI